MAAPKGEKFVPVGEYVREKFKILHQEPPRLRGVARFGEPARIHPLYKVSSLSSVFI